MRRGSTVKTEETPKRARISTTDSDIPRKTKVVSLATVKKQVMKKTEENFDPINCWWEKSEGKNKNQWEYLEHHGLMFTSPYEPHHKPVVYKNEEIVLVPEAEEVTNFWCAAMDSDYGKKPLFIKNFWNAFLSKLPKFHALRSAKFEDVDFLPIKKHLDNIREATRQQRKAMTKAEREEERVRKDQEEGPYAYALFDWLKERVGTFKSEPPSLFRGRGEHPKMGVLKSRIFPEEVTLNLHEDAPVPRLPKSMLGHCWKDVFHDNTVSWLGFYKDTVNGQFKYTFLSPSSAVKGQKDYLKYEKARKLKNYIDHIRQDYTTKMKASDVVDRQLGTATYMLDILALRVGNEKDSTEEADTVGCCSLRVEHIIFNEKDSSITLDFLGKDSIRYLNTVAVDPLVFKNLLEFSKSKSPDESIFNNISTGTLNKYLREQMQGLSAKVFRTYNASATLQSELNKLDNVKRDTIDISNPEGLKHFYEMANREVAILCNHQRSVPKQHASAMDKMQAHLNKLNDDLEECYEYIKFLKSQGNNNSDTTKKFVFVPLNNSKDENLVVQKVSVIKNGMKLDVVEKLMRGLKCKIESHELKMKLKDDNKTVSNVTSKQHYMDPRITVAFCKKWELPIEKLFNTTLRKKFPWAMYARSDFCF